MYDIKDIPQLMFEHLGAKHGKTSKPQKVKRNRTEEWTVFEMKDVGFIAYTEIPLLDLGSKSAHFEVWPRLPEQNEEDKPFPMRPAIEIRGAPFPTGSGPGNHYHERLIILFPNNIIISNNDLSKPIWILAGEAMRIASEMASSPECEKGAIYWERDRVKELQQAKT